MRKQKEIPSGVRQVQEGEVRQGGEKEVTQVTYRDSLSNGRLADRMTDASVASIRVLADPNGVPHTVFVTYSNGTSRSVPWANVRDIA
jgi:hypothetical protein